jgi:hypothetical protein
MALLRNYDFDTNFADVYTIQANGQVLDPVSAPDGIPDRLEIADWGGAIGRAMRATLYEGDAPTAGASSYRSEIAFPHYNDGAYWVSWEVFIPAGTEGVPAVFDGTTAQALRDFDSAGDGADDPMLGFHLQDDWLEIKTHADFINHSGKQTALNQALINKGRWVTLAYHIYFDNTVGFREFFVDGRFIVRSWQLRTVHAEAGRWYHKVGVYNYNSRSGYTRARAYYRNIRFYDNNETHESVLGVRPIASDNVFVI